MFSAAKLVDSNICELGLELAGVGERYEKPDADIPAATYLVNRLCVVFGWVIAVSVIPASFLAVVLIAGSIGASHRRRDVFIVRRCGGASN